MLSCSTIFLTGWLILNPMRYKQYSFLVPVVITAIIFWPPGGVTQRHHGSYPVHCSYVSRWPAGYLCQRLPTAVERSDWSWQKGFLFESLKVLTFLNRNWFDFWWRSGFCWLLDGISGACGPYELSLSGGMGAFWNLFDVLIGCRFAISFPFLSCSMTTSANTGGGCEVDGNLEC